LRNNKTQEANEPGLYFLTITNLCGSYEKHSSGVVCLGNTSFISEQALWTNEIFLG